MNPRPDIVCVGDIMVEHIVQLRSLPAPDTTIVLPPHRQEIGGPAFNISWYLSQLGHDPLLVGPFGERDRSLVFESFSSAKLDTSGLISTEGDTDRLFTMLTDNHHRSIYISGLLPENMHSKVSSLCKNATCLVLSGSRHRLLRDTFRTLAKSVNRELIAFNPSYSIYEYERVELAELIEEAHVTIVNDQEALHICKVFDVTDIAALSKPALGTFIVTCGGKGLKVYQRGTILDIPSLAKTSSDDVIGAGDAFFAGFLHKISSGASTPEAARFGSVLSAYVVDSSKPRVAIQK